MRCWIIGNGIARLVRPLLNQPAGLLKLFCIQRVVGNALELMRIPANVIQFFGRARIGKDLLLILVRFAGRVHVPKILTGRETMGFVTKVGLVGQIVFDV